MIKHVEAINGTGPLIGTIIEVPPAPLNEQKTAELRYEQNYRNFRKQAVKKGKKKWKY